MAIRIDASGDSLSRTTNLPTISGFTIMAWVYITNARATTSFFSFGESASSVRYTFGIWSDSASLVAWNGSTVEVGSTVSTNTWYHITGVVASSSGTNCFLYLNSVLNVSNDSNASVSAQKLWIGNDESSEWVDGRFAAVKVWDAVLTTSEIANELRFIMPVRKLNLNAWYPMVDVTANTNATDYSGSGNNLTTAGTLTVEDGPPVAWKSLQRKYKRFSISAVTFISKRRLLGVG